MPRNARDPMRSQVDDALEASVCGLIIQRSGAYDEFVAAGLEVKHLHQVSCQRVLAAATHVAERGSPVELLAVHAELVRLGYHDDAPINVLTSMADGVIWPADPDDRRRFVRDKVARLHELWVYRATKQDLDKLDRELEDRSPDREWLEDRIALMSERMGDALDEDDGRPETAFQAVLRDAVRGQQGAVLGMPAIDEHVGGIRPGRVCLLLARGGVAKTLMLCRAAYDTLQQGWGVVFFSLEMSLADITERFYRIASGFDQWHYEQAKFGAALDPELWTRAYARLALHEGLYTVSEMERRIVRAEHDRLRHAPGVLVCIDYMQLIPGQESMTSYERMSVIAKNLKKLAKRRQVAIAVAVQVSREAGGDGSRRLTLGAARDSGQIEEAADLAIGLRRLDNSNLQSEETRRRYKSVIFADLLKRRGGQLLDHGDEIAYVVDWRGFQLHEDLNLKAPQPRDDDPLADRQRRRR